MHETKELEPTVTVAMDAASSTRFKDREPRHYAQLCNCASRLWAQRGDFVKALDFMVECIDIRRRINFDLWGSVNNLGNIYLSQGDPERAMSTYESCLALFPEGMEVPRHALRTIKLNISSTFTILGEFRQAESVIDCAENLNDDWVMKIQ